MGVLLVKSLVLVTFSVFSLTGSTAVAFVVPFTVLSRKKLEIVGCIRIGTSLENRILLPLTGSF